MRSDEQPTLPLECGRRLTTRDRFEAFHRDHPEVKSELYRLALEALDSGRKVGMRCLWERLRWEILVEKAPADDYALNNDFAPYYSRALMNDYHELRGFFETRGV